MPRSSSNSRSSSTSTSSRPSLPPPKLWHQSSAQMPMKYTPASPPMVVQHEVPKQSFGSIVKDGIGLGAGAEIGRTAVQGFFGLFRSSNQAMPPPAPVNPVTYSTPLPQIPHYASPSYKECLEHNKNNTEVCNPFLSKDASPWTQCMEMNFYKAEYCNTQSINKI